MWRHKHSGKTKELINWASSKLKKKKKLSENYTIKKMRKQSLEWKKIFSSHIFNKELVSRTYKEFLQHNKKNKKKNK